MKFTFFRFIFTIIVCLLIAPLAFSAVATSSKAAKLFSANGTSATLTFVVPAGYYFKGQVHVLAQMSVNTILTSSIVQNATFVAAILGSRDCVTAAYYGIGTNNILLEAGSYQAKMDGSAALSYNWSVKGELFLL